MAHEFIISLQVLTNQTIANWLSATPAEVVQYIVRTLV